MYSPSSISFNDTLLKIILDISQKDVYLKKYTNIILNRKESHEEDILDNPFFINLLLISQNINFIPIGSKCTLNIIKKIITKKFKKTVSKVLKELSIPFSDTLYDNIELQYPDLLSKEFNFSRKEGVCQKKIYGYLIMTKDKLDFEIGNYISHIFTNKNTLIFLSNQQINLNKRIYKIFSNKLLYNIKVCLTGSLYLQLCGIDTEIDNIELWTYDNDLSNILNSKHKNKKSKLYSPL